VLRFCAAKIGILAVNRLKVKGKWKEVRVLSFKVQSLKVLSLKV
jgi:hypothetical protein